MANRIRGITVEIGGDTTKLDKALKGTNKELSSTQSALKDVERLLKLDPGNTTLLEQKQRLLASAVDATSQKLKTLQDAAKTADEALARGQAYEEKYTPLKASLEDVSTRLEKLKGQQDSMDEEFATGKLPDEKYQQFNKTLSETQAEFDALKQAQKEVQAEFAGAKLSQEQYDALQREIIETENSLKDLTTQADKSSMALENISTTADKVSGTAGKIETIMSPVTKGIVAIGTAAAATVPATDQLRGDLANLDTNARLAGVGLDTARNAFETFNVVSGETDSSIEAVSNLLQAGYTESNLQRAVENLAGAATAFPDTLKIESLADSLQETLATREATGQFGELLDRLGIGAQNFTDQLKMIPDETARLNTALDVLSNAGMSEYYNSWISNNEALAENRDATLDLQLELANLAEQLTPLITDLTELATSFLEWFNALDDNQQNAIIALGLLAGSISPLAGFVSDASEAVSKFSDKLYDLDGKTAAVTGTIGLFVLLASAVAGAWDDMSKLEKVISVLGLLSIAAVGAAIAVGALQSTWSMGIAAAAIVAGIIAITAAVNSATNRANKAASQFKATGQRSSLESSIMSSVPGFASGGVFAPNNPMLGVLGDNPREYEVAAPESMLRDTFMEALASSGVLSRSQGSSSGPVTLNMVLDGQTFARLFVPYLKGENARLGVDILNR